MKKSNVWQFLVCTLAFFFIGYFLRSIHYRQDLPHIQKAQAEIRLELEEIEQERELAELIERLLQEYEAIIDWNREHYEN